MRASGFHIAWFSQPQSPNSYQLRVSGRLSEGETIELARKLESLGVVFEIEILEAEKCLLMHHPGLGLKRVPLDASGEPVVRFGRLESLLFEAKGNNAELSRLLRLEKGQAWFDLLEPYRRAAMRVEGLLRAV